VHVVREKLLLCDELVEEVQHQGFELISEDVPRIMKLAPRSINASQGRQPDAWFAFAG
jgi:hypothetical protein